MIRKATEADIDGIEAIYDAIHDAIEAGKATVLWKRGDYPIRKDAENGVARGDMFVLEDENGKIVSSMMINHDQEPADLIGANWEYPAPKEQVSTIHTLTVHPAEGGNGYARQMVEFFEKYSKEHGAPYLRIDTGTENTRAQKLYYGMGYKNVDEIPCKLATIEGLTLICLEKKV